MKEKKDDFLEKVRRWSIQIVEEKKREKQKIRKWFLFISKDAPPIFREVMEITSGKGIRPYRNGKELEEYRNNVHRCLRRKKGFPPDEVANMMGFEDDQALYEALYWSERKPEVDIPEYIQDQENDRLKPKYSIPLEMEPDFLYLEEQERKRKRDNRLAGEMEPDFLYLEEQERKREEKERELEKIWYEEVCLF